MTDIPSGVYWSREAGNFYDARTHQGMGLEFYRHWQERKDEFPERATTTTAGLDLNYDKSVQPTGEDHGPFSVEDFEVWETCEACCGTGTIDKAHPFPDDPYFVDERRCEECGGCGRVQH